ncbi:MAG: hypothetical protein Q8T11_16955 [Elusimicrobiota bacterium]|nr:hypothetical protein [Elusimicrobiota bacterium]
MSEPAPEKVEAPVPAPGLVELLELSLTALVNAPGAFAKLDARPVPGPGVAAVAALAWGALFFALNLVHVALSSPALLQSYPPWQIAVVGVVGLGAWASLYLLGSSLIYGLGRALGSGGDFDRALLIAAFALAAAPVHALARWVPAAWPAPIMLAAWICACGLGVLFKANPWAARGVCAVLAAVVLGLQYGAGRVVARYSDAARMAATAAQAAPSPEQMAELQRQMQQVQELALQTPALAAPQGGGSPGGSSLDLLRGPASGEAPEARPTEMQQLAQLNAQGDAANRSMVAMLDSITPMLSNPAITQNMGPQQKADYAELIGMIQQLKADAAANTITSPAEQQAKMMKIQGLVMRMMSAGIAMPKPQAPPESRK